MNTIVIVVLTIVIGCLLIRLRALKSEHEEEMDVAQEKIEELEERLRRPRPM